MSLRTASALLLTSALAFPLAAQETPPPPEQAEGAAASDEDAEAEAEEIVVTGARQPGAVVGDIAPEVQLSPADIRAYGASDLAELLDELAPLTGSARGRGGGAPVVLLDGKRIGGFREIRSLPPEAIQRIDILPEEVALKYGYRADQRVVNVVLRRRFQSVTAELDTRLATGGGRASHEVELNQVTIRRGTRLTIDAEYAHDTPLYESERNILPTTAGTPLSRAGNVTGIDGGEIDPALSAAAGVPTTIAGVPAAGRGLADFAARAGDPNPADTGDFRTLLGAQDRFELGATFARTILGNVSASANVAFEGSEGRAALGLPTASLLVPVTSPFSPFGNDALLTRAIDTLGPLQRDTRTRSAALAMAFNGSIGGDWRWSLTTNIDRDWSTTLTDRDVDDGALVAGILAGQIDPFGAVPATLIAALPRDRAESVALTGRTELVVNGDLVSLPAGDLGVTIKSGLISRSLDSESTRGGIFTATDLGRNEGSLQINADLPIASRRRDVLSPLGNLTLNGNASVERLSDFGTLTSLGYGLNWEPLPQLRLLASVTHEEGAPTIQQLGNPVLATPGVRVIDFTTGETVEVTRIEGGNPLLGADSRRVIKLGATLRPLSEGNLSITADYVNERIDDVIASFPTATPEIERAFPDRFVRAGDGTLLRIDSRPVNFAQSRRSQIRWGFNFSEPLERKLTEAQRAEAEARRERFREMREQRRDQRAEGAAPDGGGEARRAGNRSLIGGSGGGFGGRGGFGGGGFGRGGGGGGGRLQLGLFHTWRLTEEIDIRDGLPTLDLLGGSATGNRGGQSRHTVELRAGVAYAGFGARLNADWNSATRVLADPQNPGGSPSDLFFDDYSSVSLRLTADLGQVAGGKLAREHPFLRGSRVQLAVDNLFDARQQVTDASGATPLGYQRDLIDPLGRTVRLSFRKLF